MLAKPLVSIIIPVYNGSNFLEDSIKSALAQTYSKIEVIVINDGSIDNGATERIALKYKDKIKYYWQENGGVASALNLGIEKMSGEYFSWLSHDDIYLKRKIEVQVDALKNKGQKDIIVSSGFYVSNERLKIFRRVKTSPYFKNNVERSLLRGNFFHGCTLLIPRICFEKVGTFNKKLKTTQDFDMWLRLSRDYEFINLKDFLVISRVHGNQDTNTKHSIHLTEKDTTKLFFLREYQIKKPYDNELFIESYFDSWWNRLDQSKKELREKIIENVIEMNFAKKSLMISLFIIRAFKNMYLKVTSVACSYLRIF